MQCGCDSLLHELKDGVLLTGCFFWTCYITRLKPLNTVMESSSDTKECGKRKPLSALTRPLPVCPCQSQLQSAVKVTFFPVPTSFSGLYSQSDQTSRHGQTLLGGIVWLLSLLTQKQTHTASLRCLFPLSHRSFYPHPSSSSLACLPPTLGCSRGLFSGSALQASPLLIILHQPWSKRRTGIHLIRKSNPSVWPPPPPNTHIHTDPHTPRSN